MKNLQELKQEYSRIEKLLSSQEVLSDTQKLQEYSKQYNDLKEKIELMERLERIEKQIQENAELQNTDNQEMKELAQQEIEQLNKERADLLNALQQQNQPDAHIDQAIIEIRPGVGGEESSLFAQDLMRMYMRYAEKNGYKAIVIDENRSELKGIKQAIIELSGKNIYSLLKHESGVHRVQRIPETETSGRIHTSTASVAVLPKAKIIDMNIRPEDIRVEAFRSSGPGGQNVNKVSTAIRVVHIPSGTAIVSQQGRSQAANRETALTLLRSRLLKEKMDQAEQKRSQERKEQIGSAERSEKIRTYNFPQNRVTDHRIDKSWYNLEKILDGTLDDIIASLQNTHKFIS